MEKHRKITTYEIRDGNIVKSSSEVSDESVSDTNPDIDSEIAFELFREKRERRAVRRRNITVCISAGVIFAALALVFFLVFRITDVTVEGSAVYTETELLSALDTPLGRNLFLTDMEKLTAELTQAYPSLENIKVERVIPGKLQISVNDSYAKYYMELDGEYLLLSDKLRIISAQKEVPENLIQIVTSGIKSAVIGNKPEFETDTHLAYLDELLITLKESPISENVLKIDMCKKFDIELYYLDRFVIKIGNTDNLSAKLILAESYIKTLSETDEGIIDASSIKIGSFTPNKMN